MLVTTEDHALYGGLGQVVAHVLMQHGSTNTLLTFGFADRFMHQAGSRGQLESLAGLDVVRMAQEIEKKVKE